MHVVAEICPTMTSVDQWTSMDWMALLNIFQICKLLANSRSLKLNMVSNQRKNGISRWNILFCGFYVGWMRGTLINDNYPLSRRSFVQALFNATCSMVGLCSMRQNTYIRLQLNYNIHMFLSRLRPNPATWLQMCYNPSTLLSSGEIQWMPTFLQKKFNLKARTPNNFLWCMLLQRSIQQWLQWTSGLQWMEWLFWFSFKFVSS